MPEFEILKLLVRGLVLPPGGILMILLAGLVQWNLRPRFARVLITGGVALLWLSATPWVANAYEMLLTEAPTLDEKQARSAQAIVIPAAGLRTGMAEYGGTTLGRLTLERVRYGARLARATGLPVLVTGGSGIAPDTEAELMKAELEEHLHVPVRWMEDRSANTRENAAETARLLRPKDKDGARRIVLIAHGFDMYRAQQEFAAVGFDVVPAPTQAASLRVRSIADVLPSFSALERTHYVSYELLALGWGWVQAWAQGTPKSK